MKCTIKEDSVFRVPFLRKFFRDFDSINQNPAIPNDLQKTHYMALDGSKKSGDTKRISVVFSRFYSSFRIK